MPACSVGATKLSRAIIDVPPGEGSHTLLSGGRSDEYKMFCSWNLVTCAAAWLAPIPSSGRSEGYRFARIEGYVLTASACYHLRGCMK